MRIGVPKEVKTDEYRVGASPAAVRELVAHGHDVFIERSAGIGAGFEDSDYEVAGGRLLDTADAVFESAELIVKVKEPQAEERARLREHHTLFTFLHLAPDVEQTQDLMRSGATCIAYETVTDEQGQLPLLAPMSEVAGRLSVQAGARCLEKPYGGRGVLLSGVPGVAPASVTIIGGGTVGRNALSMAVGAGARVTVLDRSVEVLRALDSQWGSRVQTVYSTEESLETACLESDLVIGAVLVPGARAPSLVTRKMIEQMRPGSVVVDVAIDQGGCIETARPTTHANPTYTLSGVVHYCVANMPGAVPRTATQALTHVTLPYLLQLADQGVATALRDNPRLLNGLNVSRGGINQPAVAEAQNLDYSDPGAWLGT